ncbi:hypothetical protein XH94_36955 [Bradyrhizobium zhanjiangense]|uniref:Uncharacterized protein n=1 Tax=Bradyrhizobium zhanjiangense TaxID=1325107 RepID=A0A4Q0RVJ9_9BRAD|nr:hypothetical protein XH94_36955 [Bradyrhizobium zhanjiangense]
MRGLEGKPRADYDPMVRIEKMRGGFAPLTVTGRKSLQEALKYCFKPGAIFYTKVGGSPAIVGAHTRELFDPNDGKGLRWLPDNESQAIHPIQDFSIGIAVEPSICG